MDDVKKKIQNHETIDVGPVIEGNRMVKQRSIKFRYDTEWSHRIARGWQIFYYIASFPIMFLNRYEV